ncbi:Ig-like domain-containing protein [Pontibacter sp. SGAir0037]|uniref:Ig-like domain-containing protein n=1 Tax=Pontibacter sp. SGAir0037 TaxID=2571030 RepID=UPI0010CCD0AE|nr:Ig-like domain-containing protein [Pontibacter sp. SGAir0037]QCR21029.1 hypothetical protein C1N53_00715 [Pontibacter sp. SGAir0037]
MRNLYSIRIKHDWFVKLALLAVLGFYAVVPANAQVLVWEENFNGNTINPENWTFDFGDGCERGLCGWGNQELQYYTSRPENARIEDGNLVIEARRENFQSRQFTSARMKSYGRVQFKYGTLEARIKVPDLKNGLWPAFWLLGSTGTWPASGEIDILEMGAAKSIADNVVNKRMSSAVHWQSGGNKADYSREYTSSTDLTNEYHIYKMTWNSEAIRVYLDDIEVFAFNIEGAAAADLEEFHRTQYILLNLAIGGQFTGIYGADGITAPLPAKMYVDYIRLYQNPGDELFLGKDNAEAGNYGVYSERADLSGQLSYGQDANLYIWNNLATVPGAAPFEGNEVLALRAAAGNWFGLGISNEVKNLQNFADGSLKFHFKTTYTGQFKIGIASGHGESWIDFPPGVQQYGLVRDGQWHEVTIPLSMFNNPNMGMHIDLGSVNQIFMFAGDAPGANTEFYFDNIYYSGGVAANPAPTVSLTAPANEALLSTLDDIVLTADAADENGYITKVDFYNGLTLIGTDETSPYSFTWSNVAAGVYTLSARATDNEGVTRASKPATVFVAAPGNTAPTVSITSPTASADFTTPANVVINANAADADGMVYKVDFYNGSTLLGSDFTSPYSFTWANVAAGTYTITARVTDNGKLTTTSEPVTFVVKDNTITADKYGVFTEQAAITQKATLGVDANLYVWNNLGTAPATTPFEGTDALAFRAAPGNWFGMGVANNERNLTYFENGAIKFYMKTTATVGFRIGVSTTGGEGWISFAAGQNQYGLVRDGAWHEVTIPIKALGSINLAGVNQLFMFAGDAPAATSDFYFDNIYYTAEAPANTAPSVSITAPANNAVYTAPANITINATATDLEGPVSKVEFYSGGTLLGTDTTSPFSFTWNNVTEGNYAITAKAYDNGGLSATSAAVSIAVSTPVVYGENLALRKPVTVSSTENPGTPGSNAVDGNGTTRWSSAFSDPQWLTVDLGETYTINMVKVVWEPAFASDYQLQISADNENWTTVKTITGNTTLVNEHPQLSQAGRYVRIYGTKRATPYGYSLYELEVYGKKAAAFCGTAANGDYSYSAVTEGGKVTYTFHPLTPIAGTDFVLLYSKPADQGGTYPGYVMAASGTDFTYSVDAPANGTALSFYFTYRVPAGGERNSSASPHTYTVGSTCGSTGPGEGPGNGAINLALHKPVTVSSTENADTPGANAVDGNPGSRWASQFADPQWLVVDLGQSYHINRVKITWEPAFAKDYKVQLSADADNWTDLKTVTGNTALVNDHSDLAGKGRYIRIYGTARATVWGYSIFELEVYGESAPANAAPTISIVAPVASASYDAPAAITIEANATDSDGTIAKVEYYVDGVLLGTSDAVPYRFAWSQVSGGAYTLTAKAYDNEGLAATSAPVSVTVNCVTVFYADADGDGYGDAASAVTACEAPAGYIARAGDCNDADASVNPEAADLCDGIDRNCDGKVRRPVAAPVITVIPSGNAFTGGDARTIYLGYGAQSVTLSAAAGTGAVYTWQSSTGMQRSGETFAFAPTAAGEYTFTATAANADACSNSATVTITVIDVRCGNKGDKVLVCHNGKENCIAPSAVQAHLAHGDKLGGCLSAKSTSAITAASANLSDEESFIAYPNPADGKTTIAFALEKEGAYKLTIYDATGAVVKQFAGKGEANQRLQLELETAAYSKGLYMLQLQTDDKVATQRLVIQH